MKLPVYLLICHFEKYNRLTEPKTTRKTRTCILETIFISILLYTICNNHKLEQNFYVYIQHVNLYCIDCFIKISTFFAMG